MTTPLALVVDDRPADQLAVAGIIREEGFQVLFAEGFSTALAAFRPDVGVVICRGTIARSSCLELIREWQRLSGEALFLLLLDENEPSLARPAIKAGAAGYLLEPTDPEELRAWLRRFMRWLSVAEQARQLTARLDERFGFEAVVGQSKSLQLAVAQARAAAASTGDVLVTGEPGTGRTRFAEMIHQNSRRAEGPFVLFRGWGTSLRQTEFDLFGRTNGGPRNQTPTGHGLFPASLGGSLMICDIADLAIVTQGRLLRKLERRLPGGAFDSSTPPSDVRIIAGTARRLDALVAETRFSSALYHRLRDNQVYLSPLRERREDIPLLVDHFLRAACARDARPVPALEIELSRFLQRFDWPANVRQLKDCLESMLALGPKDLLTLDDLPAHIDDPAHDGSAMYFPAGMSLGELERSAVEQALVHTDGNRTRAAERLGISVRTLQRKLKNWSLEGIDEISSPPHG